MSLFLTQEEVAELTGKGRKSLQILQLRLMGIAFYINACGRPIVCRSAIEGRKEEAKVIEKEWTSNAWKAA